MRVSTHREPVPDDVDDFVVEVYERVLANPGLGLSAAGDEFAARRSDVERAVRVLRRLRLLKEGEPLVAVSPEAARAELFLPVQRAQRQLLPFADAFGRAQRGRSRRSTTAVYRDLAEIEARLARAAHECESEALMMQTCIAQEPPEARSARPLVLDAVRRGARVRLLYPHTGRGDTVTRSYLRDVTEAGGEVRTSSDIFERFIVFDRRTAFILTPGDDADDHAVAVVEEPVIAEFLCRVHDHAWRSAMRFNPRQPGYSDVLDVLKSSILTLLASGLTDNAIARRVGISERTLRRHIAVIMRDMSADSRFQAGVTAAKAGLVQPPVEPPAVQPALVQPASAQPVPAQPALVQPALVQPVARPSAVQPPAVGPPAVQHEHPTTGDRSPGGLP
ncbi:LuxR C-terminal-related transcriptional regulator [Actinosynnema sp. CS-041913]|uniref:LuxR C-terminal-related transcriptional regulator n=1 Tax=Actinosynnema sp. CS-041913 TaxID=3239917 RepID=UPI003D8E4792